MRYNQMRHKVEVGPTKRKKVREVDFGNVLPPVAVGTNAHGHILDHSIGQIIELDSDRYQKTEQKHGQVPVPFATSGRARHRPAAGPPPARSPYIEDRKSVV